MPFRRLNKPKTVLFRRLNKPKKLEREREIDDFAERSENRKSIGQRTYTNRRGRRRKRRREKLRKEVNGFGAALWFSLGRRVPTVEIKCEMNPPPSLSLSLSPSFLHRIVTITQFLPYYPSFYWKLWYLN